MPQHDDFFNTELDDESRIKLGVLSWFLTPWSWKLGSFEKNTAGRTIWYVDGFAGPGKNELGERGSPLIAATQAKHIANRSPSPGFELAMFNIEKTSTHFDKLETNCQPFVEDGARIINRKGLFADHVAEIIDITSGSPVLLFIDPWGFTGFNFDALRPFLEREAPLDIIFRLHHGAIHRLKPDNENLVTATVGSARWLDNWDRLNPDERVAQTLGVFRNSYMSAGRFLDLVFYPVRLNPRKNPSYTLGFASRKIQAFRLWNNKIAGVEAEIVEYVDRPDTGQLVMQSFGLIDGRVDTVRAEVLRYFRQYPESSWQKAYDRLIFISSTPIRETELTQTIKYHIDEGIIRRVGGSGTGIRKGIYSPTFS